MNLPVASNTVSSGLSGLIELVRGSDMGDAVSLDDNERIWDRVATRTVDQSAVPDQETRLSVGHLACSGYVESGFHIIEETGRSCNSVARWPRLKLD